MAGRAALQRSRSSVFNRADNRGTRPLPDVRINRFGHSALTDQYRTADCPRLSAAVHWTDGRTQQLAQVVDNTLLCLLA